MFIIENGKISGNKTVDIGKSIIVNLEFKSDIAFADDDKLLLNIGGLQSSNYAFTQNGCFRFSYVNVGSLITSSSNSVNVVITNNGTQILSDSITMIADYQGGGGTVTAEFPLTTERVQLFTKRVGNNQYQLSKVAPDSTISIKNVLGSKQTAQHQFNYNLDFNYQISPVDDLKVVIGLNNKDLYVTAQLYIDDVLIKKGISYRRVAGSVIPDDSYYKVIDLNENFANELITNTVGKNLKLKIYVYNDSMYSTEYYIRSDGDAIYPASSPYSDTGGVKLLKNIPLSGMDQLYGFARYETYLTDEKLPSMFSAKPTVEKYNSKSSFTISEGWTDVVIPALYFESYQQFQPNTYFDLNIDYNAGYFTNPKLVVIRIADTLEYYNVSITTSEDQRKDILINKPFDFQPNKAYMICCYQNIIVWQELQNY